MRTRTLRRWPCSQSLFLLAIQVSSCSLIVGFESSRSPTRVNVSLTNLRNHGSVAARLPIAFSVSIIARQTVHALSLSVCRVVRFHL